MKYPTVVLENDGPIFRIVLNIPERLNALSDQVLVDLSGALDECASSHEIRVLVLTGAGRGFCAGADLKTPKPARESDQSDSLRRRISDQFNPIIKKLLACLSQLLRLSTVWQLEVDLVSHWRVIWSSRQRVLISSLYSHLNSE